MSLLGGKPNQGRAAVLRCSRVLVHPGGEVSREDPRSGNEADQLWLISMRLRTRDRSLWPAQEDSISVHPCSRDRLALTLLPPPGLGGDVLSPHDQTV